MRSACGDVAGSSAAALAYGNLPHTPLVGIGVVETPSMRQALRQVAILFLSLRPSLYIRWISRDTCSAATGCLQSGYNLGSGR